MKSTNTPNEIKTKLINELNLSFDLIADNPTLSVIIVDENEDILYVNETFCNQTSYNFNEIIGTNLTKYSFSSDYKHYKENTNERRKKGLSDNYSVNFIDKNGSIIQYVINVSPLFKNTKYFGTIAIMVKVEDILESRSKTNEKLNFTDFLSQTTIFTDENFKIKHFEKIGFNFLNLHKNKSVDKAIFDIISDNYKNELQNFIVQKKGSYRNIIKVKIFNNQELSVFVDVKPIRENNFAYRFVFTDLSHFMELRKKLERSEEQYKLIFKKTQSPLLLFDSETGNIFEVNNAAAKVIQDNTQNIINSNINDIVKSDDGTEFMQLVKSKKNIQNKIFKIKDKLVKIAVSYIEFYDQKYYQLSLNDYTRIIEKEEKDKQIKSNLLFLNQTAQFFLKSNIKNVYTHIGRFVSKITKDSIIIVSAIEDNYFVAKSISGTNKTDREILNKYNIGINIKMKYINIRDKAEKNKAIDLNKKDFKKNFCFESEETYFKFSDEIGIKSFYSVLLSVDDEIYGTISILSKNEKPDNLEYIETFAKQASMAIQKNKLEQKLKQEKERAESADKIKTAFLANMSHEIRTPMNNIIGFAEMLAKEVLSDEEKERYYSYIDNSSQLLLNIIDDILDISKIEAGELKLINEEFEVYSILKEQYNSYKHKVQKSVLKFKLNVPNELRKAKIVMDKFRFRQIINNLLSNAFKYTDKGKIEFGFTIDETNNELKLFVSDTGKGIAKHLQQSVLDRFNRGTEKFTQGTGLGLPISKQLTELMGGKFEMKSKLNKGTSFYITFPYKQTSVKPKKKLIKEKQVDTSWENKEILIVEDEDCNFILLKEILKTTGVKIEHAENGKEAVKMCAKKQYDLVLMDIKMPKMDGFTATSRILEFNPNQKIMAQTAYAMTSEKEKAIRLGCVDFIAKPIKKQVLLDKMSKILNK